MAESTRSGDGQSISRAVAVLRAVAEAPGASLGEIARETGLARSTVQRLVAALHAEGLLAKSPGQQGVALGFELARLGARVQLDLRQMLRPLMEALQARVRDNIDLTLFENGKVVVIEQLACHEGIRVLSHVGREHPVHCTANGKAHLAQLPRAAVEALLAPPLTRFTDRTLTDPQALRAHLAEAAGRGLFVDREEFAEETCAMAIALPMIGPHQLALGVAMPRFRFLQREAELAAALRETRIAAIAAFGTA